MILRSKDGSQGIAIPNYWYDSNGEEHEYPADFKTLQVTFDIGGATKNVEFIKIGD